MNCICYAFFFFLTSFLGGIGTFSSLIYIQLMKLNVKQIILFQDEISTVNWNWFSVILALIISAVVGLPPFTISTTLCQQPIKLPITFVWKLELSSSKPGVFFFSFLSVTVEELRTNVFGLETAGSKRELPPNKPSYWSDIVQVLYVEKTDMPADLITFYVRILSIFVSVPSVTTAQTCTKSDKNVSFKLFWYKSCRELWHLVGHVVSHHWLFWFFQHWIYTDQPQH